MNSPAPSNLTTAWIIAPPPLQPGHADQAPVITAMLLQRTYGRSLLLLDEPFIGLDLFSQRYLRHFVGQELRHDNFSMILATHQPEDIEALCDEVDRV